MQVNTKKPEPIPLITPEVFNDILESIVANAKRDRKQAQDALREVDRIQRGGK